jgi:hypothetical protein
MLSTLLNKLTLPLYNVIAFEPSSYPLTYKIERLDRDLLVFGKLRVIIS